jgi:ABC-type transporter Mla subunit MlaD
MTDKAPEPFLGLKRNLLTRIKELEEERDKLKSILGRYASGVGAAEGVFFENYGSLEKDEQALVRTLADIWENA